MQLEGQFVLAAYVDGATAPGYFIVLGFDGDRVQSIRDYRYVPYMVKEADLTA